MDDLALYLAAGRAAHPIADWALNQVLTYGPGVALCGTLYALYCTTDAIARRYRIRRTIRRLEHLANHPGAHTTNTRKETP
jgi:hypothetical protein